MELLTVSEKSDRSEAGFFCPAYVGLRTILLVAVVEGHYWFEQFPQSRVGILTQSVSVFFALSGFLISHTLFCYESLPPGRALATFYVRRALRILPAYFLVLGVANACKPIPYLGWNLLYLLNIKVYLISRFDLGAFQRFLAYGDFNASHFWSVCVEEQFYLLYPLFVLASPRRWRSWLLLALIGLSILCRVSLQNSVHRLCFYGGLPVVAGEYILWGCLWGWMDFRQQWTWLRSPWALYGSLLIWAMLAWTDEGLRNFGQWRPTPWQTVYAILIATFVASLRHNGGTLLARGLAWKPLRRVGMTSYGAYLIHPFLNPLIDPILREHPWLAVFPACPRAVLGLVLTVALALLLWYGFEKPIQELRNSWNGSVKKPGAGDRVGGQTHQLQQETEERKPPG